MDKIDDVDYFPRGRKRWEKKFEYIFRKKDLDLNLLSMLSLPRCEFPMNTKINPKKKKKEKAT